jgi:hypothetical protein
MAYPGIVIPDLVVQRLVKTLLKALLDEDSPQRNLASMITRTLPAEDRDSFLTALRNRAGEARLAFARTEKEDWQVVVMMTDAADPLRTTGDEVGTAEDSIGDAILNADLPEAIEGIGLPLLEVPADLPSRGRVRIGGFDGEGGELAIYTKSGDAITLAYRGIGGTTAAAHTAGEDVSFNVLSSRIGWEEYCTVRVDVLSTNAFFNAVLSTVIKGGLLAARDQFEVRGLTLKSLRESALQPRPRDWPQELLNRTLTLVTHRRFAVPETLAVVTGIEGFLTAEIGPRHDDAGFP